MVQQGKKLKDVECFGCFMLGFKACCILEIWYSVGSKGLSIVFPGMMMLFRNLDCGFLLFDCACLNSVFLVDWWFCCI